MPYKSKVQPHKDKIATWCEQGLTDKEIARLIPMDGVRAATIRWFRNCHNIHGPRATWPRYPLTLWRDGGEHTIVAGTDFDNDVESMRKYFYSVARRHDERVTTRVSENKITFKFTSR